jgi:hypothetical protein
MCRTQKCCNTFGEASSIDDVATFIEGRSGISRRAENHGDRQLDLFDPSPPCWGEASAAPSESMMPTDMTDAQLLERFSNASVGNVRAFGEELRLRRPAGWQDAAIKLWDRFRGFGHTQPMVEQQVVLSLAKSVDDHRFVRDLLAAGPIGECIEPDLLRAAAVCRVALPKSIVERGLAARVTDVRRAAVQLAIASDVPSETLLPYLSDPARIVRREAAIALANAGQRVAISSLLLEMRIQPSRAGLEALGFVADEDIMIGLGQIARQHPDWCPIVLEVLESIGHPTAEIVAAGLVG